MKQANCSDPGRGQRGDALIEALFGILLMAVIGLGLSYATSRAVFSQRYLNTQNVVISQMRESLITADSLWDLCHKAKPTAQLGNASTELDLRCQKNPVTVAVAGSDKGHGNDDDHGDDKGDVDDDGEGGGNGKESGAGISKTLGADTLVTTLTVTTPTTDENAALIGGDGKIEVSL